MWIEFLIPKRLYYSFSNSNQRERKTDGEDSVPDGNYLALSFSFKKTPGRLSQPHQHRMSIYWYLRGCLTSFFWSLNFHHSIFHTRLASSPNFHHSIFFTLFVGPYLSASAAFLFYYFFIFFSVPKLTKAIKKLKKKKKKPELKTEQWKKKQWTANPGKRKKKQQIANLGKRKRKKSKNTRDRTQEKKKSKWSKVAAGTVCGSLICV